MEYDEIPLVMLSVMRNDDELTFQSGFAQQLDDAMSDDERSQVNAAIDTLLDLIEPIFMRIAPEAFADNHDNEG